MAHELRNPLAIIRSTLQNLEETLEPGESETRRSCRFVLDEIDRLTRVTSSIVRFARPLRVERTRIDARKLFERCAALAERMLGAQPVRLERKASGSAVLDVDPDLICQALLGLIDNAARFSAPGTAVELGLDASSGEVELYVADSGPGVPAELAEKLFEPFFTTREDGTGLGLPIVRQIVQAHGGSIRVGERAGGGARFEIRLARAGDQELAA
jgi:signal transduction histidine kinase